VDNKKKPSKKISLPSEEFLKAFPDFYIGTDRASLELRRIMLERKPDLWKKFIKVENGGKSKIK
jgi:hypothetical protein